MSGSDPRVPTIDDLRRIVARAETSPAERERLLNSTEGVLRAENLIPVPSAVAFLQSMGRADYTPPKPSDLDPNGQDKGEM